MVSIVIVSDIWQIMKYGNYHYDEYSDTYLVHTQNGSHLMRLEKNEN